MVPPALRERREVCRAVEKLLVLGVRSVEVHNVGDRHGVPVSGDEVDRIAGCDLSFADHSEVEAGTPALEKMLEDIRAAEPDAELEAGHPGLRDQKLC